MKLEPVEIFLNENEAMKYVNFRLKYAYFSIIPMFQPTVQYFNRKLKSTKLHKGLHKG